MLTKTLKAGDLVLFTSKVDYEPKREPEFLEVEYVESFIWVKGNNFNFRGDHISESPRDQLFDSQEDYGRSLKRFYHFTEIKKAVIEYGVLRELSDDTLAQIHKLIEEKNDTAQ